jgi:predicted RNA-binding protein with PUA-like domain
MAGDRSTCAHPLFYTYNPFMSKSSPKYWLAKSEATCYSIDDLKKDKTTCWDGIRNYQARNFMRDEMKVGDLVLFYHSNAEPPGVAGVAKVVKEAYPDHTQFDPKEQHYDPKSKPDNPAWLMVDLGFVEKFKNLVSLEDLRSRKELADMLVLRKGQRLSLMPVEEKHFELVRQMGSQR